MNKNRLIKIVSFFLSIPCLANGNIFAMKNPKIKQCSKYNLNSCYGQAEERKFGVTNTKYISNSYAKLQKAGDSLLLYFERILRRALYPGNTGWLAIISYMKEFGILIPGDSGFCKFVIPVDKDRVRILKLNYPTEYKSIELSQKLEKRKDYEEILKLLGYSSVNYLSSEFLKLRKDSDLLLTELGKEQSDDIERMLNQIQEIGKFVDFSQIRASVNEKRKNYGKYVLKELRPKNSAQKSNKELDNGSDGNSERDKKVARRKIYARVTLEERRLGKLVPRIRKITDEKSKFNPILTFGKADKNKKTIEASPHAENQNEPYNMNDTSTTLEKDLLRFTFGSPQ